MVINNLATYKAYGETVQFEYKEYKTPFNSPTMRKQLIENNSLRLIPCMYDLGPDLKLPYPKFFTRRPWGRLFLIGASKWFREHYRIKEPQ